MAASACLHQLTEGVRAADSMPSGTLPSLNQMRRKSQKNAQRQASSLGRSLSVAANVSCLPLLMRNSGILSHLQPALRCTCSTISADSQNHWSQG